MKLLIIWLTMLGFSFAVQLHHNEQAQIQAAAEAPDDSKPNQVRAAQPTFVTAVHGPNFTPNAPPPQNDDAAWLQQQHPEQVKNTSVDDTDKNDGHNTKMARTGSEEPSYQGPAGTQTKTPALPAAPTNTKIPVGQSAGYATTTASARGLFGVAMMAALFAVVA